LGVDFLSLMAEMPVVADPLNWTSGVQRTLMAEKVSM
jgi:hypothetical protein